MITASKEDIITIVKILAPAFNANQSVNRCIKQDKRRFQRIENQIKYVSRISLRDKMAFLNDEKTGVILCNLSNGSKATPLDDLFYMTQVSGIKLGLQLIKREKILKEILPSINYCHLWFIGIESSMQGNGIGSKMIHALMDICKKKKLPIYLETSNSRNLKFYESNGFKLYHKTQLSMDNFELYFYKWEYNNK